MVRSIRVVHTSGVLKRMTLQKYKPTKHRQNGKKEKKIQLNPVLYIFLKALKAKFMSR